MIVMIFLTFKNNISESLILMQVTYSNHLPGYNHNNVYHDEIFLLKDSFLKVNPIEWQN